MASPAAFTDPSLGTAVQVGVQTWAVYGFIVVVLGLYSVERFSMTLVSIAALCALMVFFHLFPVIGPDGGNLLSPETILLGFANPALITVLALLVIGQGMVRTGVLDRAAEVVLKAGAGMSWATMLVALLAVLVISGFLNNIPVVVIFIPIMQEIASRFGMSTSKVMMPMSFAAVLGGMTTLIGSGTNLLVNSALIGLGETPFGFFDFTLPGLVLALTGLVFAILVVPRLLPNRAPLADVLLDGSGKHFIAQITVAEDAQLIGSKARGGLFPDLKDMTVRLIQRDDEAFLPPFEDVIIQAGDELVVAATRQALTQTIAKDPGLFYPDIRDGVDASETDPWTQGNRSLAEVMVAPASRMVGLSLRLVGFRHRTRCIVLGIQRRAHMYRVRMTDIRLEPGDVLLVKGQEEDIKALRSNPDVVVLSGTRFDLPRLDHAKRATFIFAAVVGLAATGILPIVVAALMGAAAMVATGVLNIRQATRALDIQIATMIPAALALGAALQATGGAQLIAHGLISLMGSAGPALLLSGFFLIMAVLSNVISAKATAVLFTPIAVGLAHELGVDPQIFAVAVVFAANCAFATPIGYQTSLIVMGPGHYTFADFVRGGAPLVIIVWLAFSLFAPLYYGL